MYPDTLLVPYYPGYKVDSQRDGHVYGICVLNFKTVSTKLGEYFFFQYEVCIELCCAEI
jgi:hypothetical protein